MEPSSFSALLDQLREGDTAAVEQFVAEYERAIRRELRFLLLDTRLRQVVSESDICQSVMMRFFVEFWAGKCDFEAPQQLLTFLKRMVRSRIIDLTRHWTAQRRDLRKNISMAHEDNSDRKSRDNTPSQIVAKAELLAEVQHRLSEHELKIFDWRQQGLLWPEIAERAGGGGSAEALRKQFERALARVSAELGFGGETG